MEMEMEMGRLPGIVPCEAAKRAGLMHNHARNLKEQGRVQIGEEIFQRAF
jgi:hypothetical protein